MVRDLHIRLWDIGSLPTLDVRIDARPRGPWSLTRAGVTTPATGRDDTELQRRQLRLRESTRNVSN